MAPQLIYSCDHGLNLLAPQPRLNKFFLLAPQLSLDYLRIGTLSKYRIIFSYWHHTGTPLHKVFFGTSLA